MGSGFRTFTTSEVLTASNVQNYLMEQSVMSFASTGARDVAITSPEYGMQAYVGSTAPGRLMHYDGSAWRDVQLESRTHGALIYNNANQAIATGGTGYAITMNSESLDTDSYHSTTTNTSRITIPTGLGGLYAITGYFRMESTSVTTPTGGILKNGISMIRNVQPTGGYAAIHVATTMLLAAGDYVELFCAHFTGANRNVDYVASGGTNDPLSPWLSAYLIAGVSA